MRRHTGYIKETLSDLESVAACQKTMILAECKGKVSRGKKEQKSNPGKVKGFAVPKSKLFEIHGSKFEPHPVRNSGQATVVGIAQTVFFLGIGKDSFNGFFA